MIVPKEETIGVIKYTIKVTIIVIYTNKKVT
jgi:hypothetical protein